MINLIIKEKYKGEIKLSLCILDSYESRQLRNEKCIKKKKKQTWDWEELDWKSFERKVLLRYFHNYVILQMRLVSIYINVNDIVKITINFQKTTYESIHELIQDSSYNFCIDL